MKTPEEILETHYTNHAKRIAFPENVLSAMQSYADQQTKEANGKAARMAGYLHATQSMLIAAAEEIGEHWSAHCDAEGYGPANLMRRIEDGLQTLYPGYTMGEFKRLNDRVAELEKEVRRIAEIRDGYEKDMNELTKYAKDLESRLGINPNAGK